MNARRLAPESDSCIYLATSLLKRTSMTNDTATVYGSQNWVLLDQVPNLSLCCQSTVLSLLSSPGRVTLISEGLATFRSLGTKCSERAHRGSAFRTVHTTGWFVGQYLTRTSWGAHFSLFGSRDAVSKLLRETQMTSTLIPTRLRKHTCRPASFTTCLTWRDCVPLRLRSQVL